MTRAKASSVPLSPAPSLSAGEGLMLLERSSDLVCICREGRISFINSAGARLLEADGPEALAGRDFNQFIAPEYSAAIKGFLDVLSGETEPFPAKLIGLGGAKIGAEISVCRIGGKGDGTLAIFAHDVTNRIRLSEAIQRSEARFRRLVVNARNMFCVCDENAVAFINPAGIELLGAGSAEAVVGCLFADFVHGDYRDIFSGGIAEEISELLLLPMKLVRLDGEVRDVEATILPVDRRTANRYMVEARDITEHIRAVAALHRTNVNLDRLVKERTRELTEEVAVRKRAEEMLRHAATHDGLTGLPNRGLLMDRLAAALSRARREKTRPRSCSSISTASRRSTIPWATMPATSCSRRWRGFLKAASARPTRWPGWGATSSYSCSPTSPATRASPRWPNKLSRSCPSRSSSTASAPWSAAPSASPFIRTTPRRRKGSSPRPMAPCTRSRNQAGTTSASLRPRMIERTAIPGIGSH